MLEKQLFVKVKNIKIVFVFLTYIFLAFFCLFFFEIMVKMASTNERAPTFPVMQ